jgi:hypothetical protein
LFITVTANPKWPEIKQELLPGQTASDCPDLVTQVFYSHIEHLLKDLKNGVLGAATARVYTIEF